MAQSCDGSLARAGVQLVHAGAVRRSSWSKRPIVGHQYQENGNSYDCRFCARMWPHPRNACKPNGSLERCCIFEIFHQKHQCPKSAVVGQNDHLSDSAYHRHPEAEPDIESGQQGCLFVPLTRLQTVTANDLVCAQQRCLYLLDF
jgi:hypothetical protein